jgi:hypothetical protein
MSSETDHCETDTDTHTQHYFDRPLSKATGYDEAPVPDVFGRAPATSREIAEVTNLCQSKATLKLVDTSNPWRHLPSGGFSIENGQIIAFQETEITVTRRLKEDLLVVVGADSHTSTSAKRQTERARSCRNSRKAVGGSKPRGNIRPQSGKTGSRAVRT